MMKGFTLVEGLVAVMLTFIVSVGIAGLLTFFGLYNRDNMLHTCLLQGASSAIEACRGRFSVGNLQCGNYNVSVSISGCTPGVNRCNLVTATATAGGRSFTLRDVVCNFE